MQSGRQGGFQTSKLDLILTCQAKTLQQNSNEPVDGKNLIVITFMMINVFALICTKNSHALTPKPFNRIQMNLSKDGKNLIVITFMMINVAALICVQGTHMSI